MGNTDSVDAPPPGPSSGGEPARRFGSYELVELLGQGGMGEVWRARHAMLSRHAAVKLIRPEALGEGRTTRSATVMRRFEREAQATSALRSPHTVELYDFGVGEGGTFYYVMELLEGLNLKTLVEQFGPVRPERVVYLLQQACDSLGEAHARDLVHRDVKPANLFVCKLGLKHDFVKVLDFGLVKPRPQPGLVESQLTTDGTAPGSPAFMPPEIAEGAQTIDARADIYALGCVAYWLLTGQLVFVGDTPLAVVLQHVQAAPVPPSQRTEIEIPEALEALVMRCLEKDPAARPQSAKALAAALKAIPFEEPWDEDRAEHWWKTHSPVQPLADLPRRAMHLSPPTPVESVAAQPAAPIPAPSALAAPAPLAVAATQAGPAARPVAKRTLEAQRKRTLDELQQQFVESHISVAELDKRTERAAYAKSPEELEAIVADLPQLPVVVPLAGSAEAPPPSTALTVPEPGAPVPTLAPAAKKTFVSIFSGNSRRGVWYPPSTIRSINVFGGAELDFTQAEMQPGCTTIRVFAMFGGAEITVPKDMYVQVDGVGIFGGFDDSASQGRRPPTDNVTSWIRIKGFALFGGVSVELGDEDEDGVVWKLTKKGRRRKPRLPHHKHRR